MDGGGCWDGLEWSGRGEELIPERILLRRLSHVDLVLVAVFYTLGLVSFRVVPKTRYYVFISLTPTLESLQVAPAYQNPQAQ